MAGVAMANDTGAGRSAEELREIAVEHLLTQTQFWGYVTRAEAEAAIDRLRDRRDRFAESVAAAMVWEKPAS